MPTPLVPPPRRTPGSGRPATVIYASTHHPDRRRDRRRRTRVAVLVAAAVLTAATAVPAWNALHDGPGAGDAPPVAVASSPAPSPPPGPSAAPSSTSDLTWVDHQGTLLPVSLSAGPSRQDGPLDVGFADSNFGAALAAVHITYAASPGAGPTTFRAALAEQVVGGALDQLLVTVERDYAGARASAGLADGAPLPPGDAMVVGYRVSALPAGNRHVQLVVSSPAADGTPVAFSADVVMTWHDGDWRLVAPSDGTWDSAVTRLPDVPTDVVRFDPAQPAPASLGGDD